MPQWVELGAKAIKDEQARKAQNQTYRDTLQKTLSVNSQNVFGCLLDSVAKSVEDFNVHFPDAQRKLHGPEMLGTSGFRVSRSYDPVFILTVKVAEGPAISWDTTRSEVGVGLYSAAGSFEMQIEPSGDGSLLSSGTPISFDSASQELLLPAIEGLV